MHETAKRLYQAASELKNVNGQSSLARLLNTSPQTVKNWEIRGVSQKGMIEAAKIIGCSAVWLESGKGDMKSNMTDFDLKEDFPEGYIRYDVLNITAKLGDGCINPENIEIVDTVTVAEAWARQNLGACYKRVQVISTKGDSMSETINDGDVLFVDSGIRYFDGDGIYVLHMPEGLRAKRLQRTVTGGMIVISDNPNYRDEHVSAEEAENIVICGKVKGAWSLSVF